MMKQFKKVVSILCVIALLVSGIAMAYADEATAGETVTAAEDNSAQEEAARKAEEEAARKAAEKEAARKAEEEAARKAAEKEAARKAAEEEAARKAAEEEAARKAAEEEAARKAAEEEAARKAAEEEAARKAAEEEAARQAAEEGSAGTDAGAETPAQDAGEQPAAEQPAEGTEETPEATPAAEGEDGLVEIDDGWGYVDPEVISENTPEITDELKGLRRADLNAGQSLSDTVTFGDELVITLRCGNADTVDLKLYADPGAGINVKVDGKAAGFTPAASDDPSKSLAVCTLTSTAGRNREIVLSSTDTVSFKLVAEVKQTEVQESAPANENNASAGSETEQKPTGNSEPASEPTVQVSVKTYDALKVGSRISDTLYAGQKAKVQLKCGKNPFVTLTLNANPDDVDIQIEGSAGFSRSASGNYTYEFENVAFRKFNVTISARKDLSFTLSASANTEAAQRAEEEKKQEEAAANSNKEETVEPAPAEVAPAAETTAEIPAETEQAAGGEEPAEAGSEAPAEENAEPAAEGTEEGAEEPAAEGTEESAEGTEEPAEGTEEPAEEGTEEPAAEGTEEGTEETAEGTEEGAEEGTEEGAEEENTEEETEEGAEEGTEEEPAEAVTEEEVVETFDAELPVTLSADDGFVPFGTACSAVADLTGYEEYDRIEISWFSSSDDGETWTGIEDAEGPVYDYTMSESNWYYRFRAVATVTVVTYRPVVSGDADETPAGEAAGESTEEAPAPSEEPAAPQEAPAAEEAPASDEEIAE